MTDLLPGPLVLPDPYDYQIDSIRELRRGFKAKKTGQILSSPTGSGKTVIAIHMIANAWRKRKRCLFLVDGLDLYDQTSSRLWECGIPHGKIGGGIREGLERPVIVAMKQTLATMKESKRIEFFRSFDIVFDDECHKKYKAITRTLPSSGVPYIGLTATPMVPGMRKLYQNLVSVTTTNKLADQCRLMRPVVRSCVEIDMQGAPTNGGEWSAETVRKRGRAIIGDIVSTWVSETNEVFGGPVKTMLFSSNIAHGKEICGQFQAAGYDFRQVTAHDDRKERSARMQDFRDGKFIGIASCDALGKGIDIPDVQCLIIARPYRKAFAAHIQMLGRVMRTAENKRIALVLDHSGNCIGFYDETEQFFQNGVSGLEDDRFEKVMRKKKKRKDLVCTSCSTVFPPGAETCPGCGKDRPRKRSDVHHLPGKMVTIAAKKPGQRNWTGSKDATWRACCGFAMAFQTRMGNWGDTDRMLRQAKANYHDLTGEWPSRGSEFTPANHVPVAIKRELNRRYHEWRKSQKGKTHAQ